MVICAKAPPRLKKHRSHRSRPAQPEAKTEPKLGPQLVQNEPPVEKEVVSRNLEPLPAEDQPLDEAADETAGASRSDRLRIRAAARRLSGLLEEARRHDLPGQSRRADSLGGRGAQMNFDTLVQSLYMTAALQMGAGTQPGEQPRVDILGARQSIDMLSVLVEKTKGNLTERNSGCYRTRSSSCA